MRPERNALIAIVVLLMAGCSANRLARQEDSMSDSADQVPMPIRHPDQYDSEIQDHEYHPFPSNVDRSDPSRTPVPPPVPMPEPLPAPTAFGVSRVKSVSWLRNSRRKTSSNNSPCNCGEGTTCDPGFIAPEGCNSKVKARRSYHHSPPVVKQHVGGVAVDSGMAPPGNHRGSLADPLQENGWDDHDLSRDQQFSPDEMLDRPSPLETPINKQSPQETSVPESASGLPIQKSASDLLQVPATPIPDAPAAVPQHINDDSVRRIVHPPVWPRLNSSAVTSSNAPAANPPAIYDATLPAIQPGRKI